MNTVLQVTKVNVVVGLLVMVGLVSSAYGYGTLSSIQYLPDRYVPGETVTGRLEWTITGDLPNYGMGILITSQPEWEWVSSELNGQPEEPTGIYNEDGEIVFEWFPNRGRTGTLTYTFLVPQDQRGPVTVIAVGAMMWLDTHIEVSNNDGDRVILGPEDGVVEAFRVLPSYYQANQQFLVSIELSSPQPPQSVVVEDTYDSSLFTLQSAIPAPSYHSGGTIRWDLPQYGLTPDMIVRYTLEASVTSERASYFEGEVTTGAEQRYVIQGDQMIFPLGEGENTPTPVPTGGATVVPDEYALRTFAVPTPKKYVPDQPFEVQIEMRLSDQKMSGSLSDNYPKGWTFVEDSQTSSAGGIAHHSPTTRTVSWVWGGVQHNPPTNVHVSYQVLPPSDAFGAYLFKGSAVYIQNRFETTPKFVPITGESAITDGITDIIPAPVPIIRDLPDFYQWKHPIEVTLNYTIDPASPPTELKIMENFPRNWQLLSSSIIPETTTLSRIVYQIEGTPVASGQIVYQLQPPDSACGPVSFSGSYIATAGALPMVGVVQGDAGLGVQPRNMCGEFVDEGGESGIAAFELLQLLNRISKGCILPESLLCFSLDWQKGVEGQ